MEARSFVDCLGKACAVPKSQKKAKHFEHDSRFIEREAAGKVGHSENYQDTAGRACQIGKDPTKKHSALDCR